ncbi:hypothetical protein ACFQ0T_19470 [Kitasatospora gansuensis]
MSTATSGLVEGGHNVASAQHSYPKLGSYTITVTAGSGGTTASNSVEVTTAGSHYTPYGPTRLMDTRERGKVQGWSSVKLRIGGNGGIPAGVTAVVLNVTVTEAESAGFLTAFPYGGNRPATSNVNFTAGQTVPNMVIVPVGADGSVQLYNGSGGAVQMIADVSGYFTQSVSSGYTPVPPARLVDTRDGLGAPRGQIAGRGSIPVQVAGVGRLPGAGITAVALNVTATESRNQGFLTVHPSGTARPNASNLNFGTGQTIANSVVVPVGSDGKIQVFNGSGDPADVIVDVVGYYSADGNSSYLPIDPERLADTRTAEWSSTPVPGGGYLPLALGDGMPGVTGFVLNTTVTGTRSAGFLTVAPDPNSLAQYQDRTAVWPDRPTVSSLNWQRPGATVPNLVQAVPGPYGIVDFWNAGVATPTWWSTCSATTTKAD